MQAKSLLNIIDMKKGRKANRKTLIEVIRPLVSSGNNTYQKKYLRDIILNPKITSKKFNFNSINQINKQNNRIHRVRKRALSKNPIPYGVVAPALPF